MKQHTGNWTGKTTETAVGTSIINSKTYKIIDLPGTYSLNYNSFEEKVAEDTLNSTKIDCVIIVVDSTSLERNLYLCLEILSKTSKAVLCLNLWDEAQKNGIIIDTEELSLQLGIPVVKTTARSKKGVCLLKDTALKVANGDTKTFEVRSIKEIEKVESKEKRAIYTSQLCKEICDKVLVNKVRGYSEKQKQLDELFTSRKTGIPIMIIIFAFVFWITAFGANVPSELLSTALFGIEKMLINLFTQIGVPSVITSFLFDGIYTTCAWVVSVMLPPAIIFFPLFAIIEDSGYLPRAVFNLDRIFAKFGVSGKMALTMTLGFGCNACSVIGCRIMSDKKERACGILTNSFVPCNGRLPTLIALISIFIAPFGNTFQKSIITVFVLLLLLLLSFIFTLLISKILTKSIKEENSSGFILELPPYRRPQFLKVILLSVKEKVLYVLSRAVLVSIPAGALLWVVANTEIDSHSVLWYICNFFEPAGKFIGVDGTVVTSFLLSFPANELVFPVMLMSYLNAETLTDYSSLSSLQNVLMNEGWTMLTAVNTMILCLFHFPCSTTLFAIKRETNSFLYTVLSIVIPLVIGIALCIVTNLFSSFFISLSQ